MLAQGNQSIKTMASLKKEQRETTKTARKKKMTINTYLSIITLNVDGPNSPVKRLSG